MATTFMLLPRRWLALARRLSPAAQSMIGRFRNDVRSPGHLRYRHVARRRRGFAAGGILEHYSGSISSIRSTDRPAAGHRHIGSKTAGGPRTKSFRSTDCLVYRRRGDDRRRHLHHPSVSLLTSVGFVKDYKDFSVREAAWLAAIALFRRYFGVLMGGYVADRLQQISTY